MSVKQLKFDDVADKNVRTIIQYEYGDRLSILNSKNGETIWVILNHAQAHLLMLYLQEHLK